MEKMAITVVLMLLLVAIMATPTFASGISFESLPHLSIQRSGAMTVSWDFSEANPAILYWSANPVEPPTMIFDHTEVLSSLVKHHSFEFPLWDVETVVYYKIVRDGVHSSVYSFSSLPRMYEQVNIVAYGNTGSNDVGGVHEQLMSWIGHYDPDVIVSGGNIVEDESSIPAWKNFFNTTAVGNTMSRIPYMAALGESDGGSNWMRFFDYPLTENYYIYSVGDVSFIYLDASQDYTVGSLQHNFLLGALYDIPDYNWKVVVFHNAPYSAGEVGNDALAQAHLVPYFEAYGVDLVISSNEASYQRLVHNGVNYIVTGGGGADLESVGSIAQTQYSESYHHYVELEFYHGVLGIVARRVDGTVMETFELTNLEVVEIPEKSEISMKIVPNPFNSTCLIDIDIPMGESLDWDFFLTDMSGRRIDRGWSIREVGSEHLSITWDASSLPTGVYMANLRTDSQTETRKIILAK